VTRDEIRSRVDGRDLLLVKSEFYDFCELEQELDKGKNFYSTV
jgi:hypothetical protein